MATRRSACAEKLYRKELAHSDETASTIHNREICRQDETRQGLCPPNLLPLTRQTCYFSLLVLPPIRPGYTSGCMQIKLSTYKMVWKPIHIYINVLNHHFKYMNLYVYQFLQSHLKGHHSYCRIKKDASNRKACGNLYLFMHFTWISITSLALYEYVYMYSQWHGGSLHCNQSTICQHLSSFYRVPTNRKV